MLSLNHDVVNLIINNLSLYDVIKLSRVSKSIRKIFENYLNKHPLLQSGPLSFLDKSPSLKMLRKINRALNSGSKPVSHPDFMLASKIEISSKYLLAFYSGNPSYVKVNKKTFLGKWELLRTIQTPRLNHFLCRDSLLIHYDRNRIVVDTPAGNTPSLIPYDSNYAVLNSRNAYCYVAQDKTVVVTDKSREINYLGFTFLHETETSLHLIAETFIVHYNIKTHVTIKEEIYVPKVVSTQEDLLVCKDRIIQLTDSTRYIIYKK